MTMAGYATQNRRTIGFRPGEVISHHGQSPDHVIKRDIFPDDSIGFSGAPPRPRQTTTSWRSSVREQDSPDTAGSTMASSLKRARAIQKRTLDQKDSGHSFDTSKQTILLSHKNVLLKTDGGRYVRGPLIPRVGSTGVWTSPDAYTDGSLTTIGQYAIRDTIPTSSPADLAQALFELKREGFPALIGWGSVKGKTLKPNLANEYLNLEFGLKPFLRDVKSAIEAARDASAILAKFQEGAGVKQHRQRYFPPRRTITTEVTTGQLVETGGTVANLTANNLTSMYSNSGRGTLTISRDCSEKEYFKGAYVYHLQGRDDESAINKLHRSAEEIEHLLGLKLSFELVWELLPWSWFIDWLANVGTNISNATALSQDGLVLQYGYVMRETRITNTYSLTELQPAPHAAGSPRSCHASFSVVRKRRIRATPYGFGVNPDSFTNRNWAILGALGLTKGNNSLRFSD